MFWCLGFNHFYVQSPCDPLIEDYTEIFYITDKRDISSIHSKMSLGGPRSMRKVNGMSYIFINFYVPALTPCLNSTETSLQLSEKKPSLWSGAYTIISATWNPCYIASERPPQKKTQLPVFLGVDSLLQICLPHHCLAMRPEHSSIVAGDRFRGNVFTEPLPSIELLRLLGIMPQYFSSRVSMADAEINTLCSLYVPLIIIELNSISEHFSIYYFLPCGSVLFRLHCKRRIIEILLPSNQNRN
jgi:hypothetical protein